MVLAGTLVGAGAAMLTTPTYTSRTQLFVAIQNSGSVLELQQGNSFSQARVQSYVKTVQSPVVLQPAIDSLGLNTSPEELASRVTATNELNTVLIDISVEDRSPVQAAALAQAIANSLIGAVDSLEKPKTGGTSPVSLSVITPAKSSASPTAPNTRMNIALGFVLGLVLGVGAAIVRSSLDNRVRGELDLRSVTDLPLLGGVAFSADVPKSPLLTQTSPQSPRAESFRQMRTNLQFANVAGKSRSVIVTSSLPGEGKSTTATNLAISLAQAGQKVCLVDADLRRPSVNQYLGLDRNVGLTTALLGEMTVGDLLHKWGDDDLYVLTSGRIPPNPSELLGSQEMQQLIVALEGAFDVVVIDTPPVLPVTDATVLAQHVGGVILVVGAHRIKRNELERSLQALRLVEADVLGVILNRIPLKGADAYAYSYANRESPESPTGTRPGVAVRGSSTPPTDPMGTDSFDGLIDANTTSSNTFPRERIRRSNLS